MVPPIDAAATTRSTAQMMIAAQNRKTISNRTERPTKTQIKIIKNIILFRIYINYFNFNLPILIKQRRRISLQHKVISDPTSYKGKKIHIKLNFPTAEFMDSQQQLKIKIKKK